MLSSVSGSRSAHMNLTSSVACTHAVFFLCTRLQEGITAADAARIGAGPGQAALAAKEYSE
jgi:hypothetical protein